MLDDQNAVHARMLAEAAVLSAPQAEEVQARNGHPATVMIGAVKVAALVRMHAEAVVLSAHQAEEVQGPRGRLAIATIGAVMIVAHVRIHAEVAVLHAPQAEEVTDPSGRLAIAMIDGVKAVAKGHVVHPDHEDHVQMTAAMHHAVPVLHVRVLTVAQAVQRSHGRHKVAMSESSRKVTP